jgi:hypothetical protein
MNTAALSIASRPFSVSLTKRGIQSLQSPRAQTRPAHPGLRGPGAARGRVKCHRSKPIEPEGLQAR